MIQSLARLTIAAIALASLDCSSGSDDRALRDLEVGQAAAEGIVVEVAEGLAVVRALSGEGVRLWASAPTFSFTVTSEVSRSWSIALDNVIVDGSLEGDVAPTLEADDGTRKRFLLDLPAGTTRLTFLTPDAGDRSAFRMGLLSDVQTALDEVNDVFAVLSAQNLRFVLGAGDLSQDGTVAEFAQFEAEMGALSVPYYSTLGNHDAPPGTAWHDWFGRGSFRFRFRGVQFTMLDSASATLDPLVYEWLDGWLAEGRDDVHVVAMHIPILDPIGVRNGAFGSRNEAAALLSRFAGAGVDLTLYGHIHSFYEFDNAGIPAFISGGGGALPEQIDGIGRHVMVFEIGADAGLVSHSLVRVD